jgi:hypothetical protein
VAGVCVWLVCVCVAGVCVRARVRVVGWQTVTVATKLCLEP